jgi:hypothetical protein
MVTYMIFSDRKAPVKDSKLNQAAVNVVSAFNQSWSQVGVKLEDGKDEDRADQSKDTRGY